MSLLHIRFYYSALIKIFLFFSLFCLCVHTKAHTQRRGGRPFRLKRGGAFFRERERFCSVCVFFSFVFFCVFLPSFVERGCWQHHHHSSLNKVCIYYTLFLSSSRRQRIILLLKGTYDATAPDRSIDRSFATSSFTSSFTSSSVFVFIESGKNADFSDWKD